MVSKRNNFFWKETLKCLKICNHYKIRGVGYAAVVTPNGFQFKLIKLGELKGINKFWIFKMQIFLCKIQILQLFVLQMHFSCNFFFANCNLHFYHRYQTFMRKICANCIICGLFLKIYWVIVKFGIQKFLRML